MDFYKIIMWLQWFHEKYPTCTLYNYKEKDRIIIGDEENDLDDNV